MAFAFSDSLSLSLSSVPLISRSQESEGRKGGEFIAKTLDSPCLCLPPSVIYSPPERSRATQEFLRVLGSPLMAQ